MPSAPTTTPSSAADPDYEKSWKWSTNSERRCFPCNRDTADRLPLRVLEKTVRAPRLPFRQEMPRHWLESFESLISAPVKSPNTRSSLRDKLRSIATSPSLARPSASPIDLRAKRSKVVLFERVIVLRQSCPKSHPHQERDLLQLHRRETISVRRCQQPQQHIGALHVHSPISLSLASTELRATDSLSHNQVGAINAPSENKKDPACGISVLGADGKT